MPFSNQSTYPLTMISQGRPGTQDKKWLPRMPIDIPRRHQARVPNLLRPEEPANPFDHLASPPTIRRHKMKSATFTASLSTIRPAAGLAYTPSNGTPHVVNCFRVILSIV